MRAGRILLIFGLIILIVVALVGGYLVLLGQAAAQPEPAAEEPAPAWDQALVVAAQNIPRGTLLEAGSGAVTTAHWPKEAVSELNITDAEDVYRRIARQDIARGTPIMEGMLTGSPGELASTGSDAALQIPSGKVAYALPVSRYSSVAWALEAGDHVDVLISLLTLDLDQEFQSALPNRFTCATDEEACEDGVLGRMEGLRNDWIVQIIPGEDQRPRLVTQLTVQDAVVLRIGDWDEVQAQVSPTPAAEGEPATPVQQPRHPVRPLTLVVSPQDAAVLKFMEESGASIDLMLRSAADAGREVTIESVTLEYLLEQFGIELPTKLPYGVEPSVERLQPGAAGETWPLDVEGGRAPTPRGSRTPVD